MSLQFILGSSGSGKSETLYKKISKEAQQNPDKNYLVIVPEQFTLSTQQKLVKLSPGGAVMNIDIVSFKRLAYRVFDDLGMADIPILEETGKDLVLRRIALEQEDNLKVLGKNMSRIGYVDQLKSLLSEFIQYNVFPQDLREKRDGFSNSFAGKLDDIILMYEAFENYCRDNYITAEEILNVLRDLVSQSELLKGSVIALDEFTGFTPIQYGLLREMLKYAEAVYVTLTLDPREKATPYQNGEGLFDMSIDTIRRMTEAARDAGTHIEDAVWLEGPVPRYNGRADLQHLERNLFRIRKDAPAPKPTNIFLTSQANPRDEIIAAALEINRLVREENYRYRDFALITGDVESYGLYVNTLFEKYKIPYFMDQTTAVEFSPFVEFLRATLSLIINDFSYEAVMRFLRCGFTDIEEEEIDLLDNYLLSTGIRHYSVWKKTWLGRKGRSLAFDLTQMEKLRLHILEILKPVLDSFGKKNATVSDGIVGLYEMLVGLDAEQQLWDKETEYLELGLQSKSKIYGQIYGAVMSLLDKYNDLMGQDPLDAEEFLEIFEAGLSAIDLGTIPPGYDCVTVGDVERTRLNGIKAMFLVGVNDGIVPKTGNGGGIISEYERKDLADADIELAPNLRQKAFIQRFYLYRNLTKPSEKIYISYARSDSSGKAINPSYLIDNIKKLYCDFEVENKSDPVCQPYFISTRAAKDYLVQVRNQIGEEELPAEWYALAAALEQREDIELLLNAPYTRYESLPISRNIAEKLYGKTLSGNITRLEDYAKCAYRHFLDYGLSLRERDRLSLDGLSIGNLYHKALEIYGKNRYEANQAWESLSEEERREESDRAILESLDQMGYTDFLGSEADHNQLERMKEIFRKNIWALTEQLKRGNFKPESFEVRFAGLEASENGDTDLVSQVLEDGHKLQMVGKIDRMDTYTEDGQTYLKIVDYKTGSTTYDAAKLFHGIQLQLPVYMRASLEKKKAMGIRAIPAGVLYQKIDDPYLDAKADKEGADVRELYLKALRPTGLVNMEPLAYENMDTALRAGAGVESSVIPVAFTKSGSFNAYSKVASQDILDLIQDFAIHKLSENAGKIYAGDISASPYREGDNGACSYCAYRSICGFDQRIEGYDYHRLRKYKDEEAYEAMQTELALVEGENRNGD